jgi:hypothetical protein
MGRRSLPSLLSDPFGILHHTEVGEEAKIEDSFGN